MMDLEIKQTMIGSFVPQHLLEFKGDAVLQPYFRQVQMNYEKGIVKLDAGFCESCFSLLSWTHHPRMKPGLQLTKKLQKLVRKSVTRHSRNYHNKLVKRYLSSSNQLIVRCHICQHVNKRPVLTQVAKRAWKTKLLKSSMSTTDSVSASSPSKKKKKKKKKKQKANDVNCGLIIPASFKQQDTAPSTIPNIQQASSGMGIQIVTEQRKLGNSQKIAVQYTNQSTHQKMAKSKQLREFLSRGQVVTKQTTLSDFLSSL